MTLRTRKLVGTVLLLLLVTVYARVIMLLATVVLPQTGKLGELLFYAVAGFAWILPAAYLISWMHRQAS
jgi:hypothetical protein